MKRYWFVLICILFLFIVVPAEAQEKCKYSFEFFSGSAYNFKMPLTISQSGYDRIKFNARFDTRPFEDSPYYAWRIGIWDKEKGWELEFIHHKLYLKKGPSDVQHFEITHGYNLLTINRAWKKNDFICHFGFGVVITHPETTIRNKALSGDRGLFNEGYYFSGPVGQMALGKRFYIWKNLFLTIEGKLTLSWARIPIQDGHAYVSNTAIHGLFGLGLEF